MSDSGDIQFHAPGPTQPSAQAEYAERRKALIEASDFYNRLAQFAKGDPQPVFDQDGELVEWRQPSDEVSLKALSIIANKVLPSLGTLDSNVTLEVGASNLNAAVDAARERLAKLRPLAEERAAAAALNHTDDDDDIVDAMVLDEEEAE